MGVGEQEQRNEEASVDCGEGETGAALVLVGVDGGFKCFQSKRSSGLGGVCSSGTDGVEGASPLLLLCREGDRERAGATPSSSVRAASTVRRASPSAKSAAVQILRPQRACCWRRGEDPGQRAARAPTRLLLLPGAAQHR